MGKRFTLGLTIALAFLVVAAGASAKAQITVAPAWSSAELECAAA